VVEAEVGVRPHVPLFGSNRIERSVCDVTSAPGLEGVALPPPEQDLHELGHAENTEVADRDKRGAGRAVHRDAEVGERPEGQGVPEGLDVAPPPGAG
jgi:hypothetical protein